MALTDAEKTELKNDILNAVKTESQGVDELTEVTSLGSIKSLPTLRSTELVAVPISLPGKPVTDAAATANAAVSSANTAADKATKAMNAASGAAVTVNEKTGVAQTAAETVDTVTASVNAATAAVEGSLPGSMTAETDGENDAIKLTLLGGNGKEVASVDIPGDTGSGGNTYNVAGEVPLENGYYTFTTAIAAVNEKYRQKDRCITYEASQGKWETKQFVGTSLAAWESVGAQEDLGGAGTVKSPTVNGEKEIPDAEGNVSLTIEQPKVDGNLDADSTNPVENRAAAAKLNGLDANTVFDASAELPDDKTSVRLTLTNRPSVEITSADLPAGSGGGDEGDSTTRIMPGVSVDTPTMEEGGSARFTWTYDHQYSSGDEKGESTGQKATIQVTVERGATATYFETIREVSKGSYTPDLTKYLLLGTNDIYVVAETTNPTTEKAQKKQAYMNAKSATLFLASGYDIAMGITQGGLGTGDTVTIPYVVTGTGTRTMTLYVDGVQKEAYSVARSGTTNGTFSSAMPGLSVGRHTVQIVAEMKTDRLALRSENVYIDILKRGNSAPFIGAKIVHPDGRIITNTGHSIPTIGVGRYKQCSFDFVTYDPPVTPATAEIWCNDSLSRTVSVSRSVQTYPNRFTEEGIQALQLKLDSTSYSLKIDVSGSGVNISETSYRLLFKLDASGHSNGESDPGTWESNGMETTFENVD